MKLVFVLAVLLVSGGIHEVVELSLVRELHLDNPVLESILIEEFGSILKSLVHLNDSSADRRNQVAGSLHALHGTEVLACLYLVIHFGHIYIHHITQGVLRIIGDSYIAILAFHSHIL